MAELPCDADGLCMACLTTPPDSLVLLCNTCSSPWHMSCLHPPLSSIPEGDWYCPDCCLPSSSASTPLPPPSLSRPHDVVAQILAIRSDPSLSELQKARQCQDIMSKPGLPNCELTHERKKHKMLEIFDENLNCTFCMQLADRPVTTPCGHNFCLKCFQRWIGQGKKACGKCRTPIPAKMASQPRINSALVIAIRMAKSAANPCSNGPPKPYHYIQNQDRPDKCFTTERAKKPGKANAASGKIFVTVPPDHFGPITAENDPVRGQGVLVGETWEDRMECRQWGVHLPHVAGIAGQSEYGAQSVALSGGYEDDEDHGEWFLYTGSGGRDLSGNRRTNDKQSFDQTFDKLNLALRVSCKRGYPVRVVRSHKEKRSSYAPESGVRYDGIYRIEKCWRKIGIQGFRVCRYLFVRCDNEPAPWTSDENGDRPRPLPTIDELKVASDLTERKSQPAWDWKEEGMWGWTTSPPASRRSDDGGGGQKHGIRKTLSIGQRLLKEFGCGLCKKVLRLPLSTPCGHNFCKSCLVAVFAGQKDVRERSGVGGRSLRVQRVVKRCPSCQGDINDFLTNPQVNRQMEDVIESLQNSAQDDSGAEVDSGNEKEMDEETRQEKHFNETFVSVDMENGQKPQIEGVMDNSVDVPTQIIGPDNKNDKTLECVGIDGGLKSIIDASKEKGFRDLCEKYPGYSEELLRSMLMDQEGDLGELEFLLKALEKQQKMSLKKQAESGSSSQNGNDKNPTQHSANFPDKDGAEEVKGRRQLGKYSRCKLAESENIDETSRLKAQTSRRKRKKDVSEKEEVQQASSKQSCQGSPLQVDSDSDFE